VTIDRASPLLLFRACVGKVGNEQPHRSIASHVGFALEWNYRIQHTSPRTGDSVSETTASPAFEVELPQPPEAKWQCERRAFLQLLPSLLPAYRGQFVAIHEGKVVDSGPELVPVALRTHQRYGNMPIYVDLVTDEPARTVRLSGPRLVQDDRVP
jgi:hypothetical protein